MAAAAAVSDAAKKAAIAGAIREIPDFPKKGIMFQDVSTLLLDPVAFQYAIDLLVERYRGMDVQCIAGGSRGGGAAVGRGGAAGVCGAAAAGRPQPGVLAPRDWACMWCSVCVLGCRLHSWCRAQFVCVHGVCCISSL